MEKQSVVLRFPKTLLERVDKYKEQKGFGTRTQAIFHLLQVALEQSERQENGKLITKQKEKQWW